MEVRKILQGCFFADMLNLLLNNSGRVHPPLPVFHFLSKSWRIDTVRTFAIFHTPAALVMGKMVRYQSFSIGYGDFDINS